MGCDANYLWMVVESFHYRGGVVVMITRRKEIELDDLYKFANSCSHTFLDRTVGKEMSCKIVNELIQYKKIEEELGIDLVKLIECIRNEKGIWKRENGDGKLINTRCMLTCEFGYWRVYDKETVYDLKDYGKTWALTKEELL